MDESRMVFTALADTAAPPAEVRRAAFLAVTAARPLSQGPLFGTGQTPDERAAGWYCKKLSELGQGTARPAYVPWLVVGFLRAASDHVEAKPWRAEVAKAAAQVTSA